MLCAKCKFRMPGPGHTWCLECQNDYQASRREKMETLLRAQGYRSGWEACKDRVRSYVAMGLNPAEIASKL